jgi:hypothetical protein
MARLIFFAFYNFLIINLNSQIVVPKNQGKSLKVNRSVLAFCTLVYQPFKGNLSQLIKFVHAG